VIQISSIMQIHLKNMHVRITYNHINHGYRLTNVQNQYSVVSIIFYSAAALLAMQSAVIPTAIPSVRPSVCHTLVPYPDE